jgi:hypothetical protein
MNNQKGLSSEKKGKVKNYRYQLFPSLELRHLVSEALKVTHDPLIRGMEKGWFARLIRSALTCYIAYCKTVASEIEKEKL